jgi:hypothetical protein
MSEDYTALVERLDYHSKDHGNGMLLHADLFGEAAAAITALLARNAEQARELLAADGQAMERQAENAKLREALVQHNDRLRSAASIADRDGKETNWLSFRGQCHYTLAEYHELVNEARQALKDTVP